MSLTRSACGYAIEEGKHRPEAASLTATKKQRAARSKPYPYPCLLVPAKGQGLIAMSSSLTGY
jgi:hypothetical protein